MNIMEINDALADEKFYCGRMVSATKSAPKGQYCVWNANIVAKSCGKLWFGDLNLTKDSAALNKVAAAVGEPLYILREMDARFGTEQKPIEDLIAKAVWTTNTPVPTRE